MRRMGRIKTFGGIRSNAIPPYAGCLKFAITAIAVIAIAAFQKNPEAEVVTVIAWAAIAGIVLALGVANVTRRQNNGETLGVFKHRPQGFTRKRHACGDCHPVNWGILNSALEFYSSNLKLPVIERGCPLKLAF
jgi:hypothetical protein